MYELWISVERIEGTCTSDHPMGVGTGFLIRNGRMHFQKGGPICLFSLQSILPMLTAKERIEDEDPDSDWMARVHHIQCPDPKGRVIWRMEQRPMGSTRMDTQLAVEPQVGDLKIHVETIEDHCNEGMQVGHWAFLRGSSLFLAQPFCYYAMQAALPLLPTMIRPLADDDWMATENAVICPDPQGNAILRIEKVKC